MMKYQKFLFESMLELSTAEILVLRHTDRKEFQKKLISEQKEAINNSHLYFICRKPKFRFIPESLSFDDKSLKLGFELLSNNAPIRSEGILYEYRQFFPRSIGFSVHDEYKSKLVVHYPSNSSDTLPIELIFPFFDEMNDLNSFLIMILWIMKCCILDKVLEIRSR